MYVCDEMKDVFSTGINNCSIHFTSSLFTHLHLYVKRKVKVLFFFLCLFSLSPFLFLLFSKRTYLFLRFLFENCFVDILFDYADILKFL